MKDGLVLMYVKGGTLYPVAMTEEQHSMLQLFGKTFEPVKVIDQPQGKAVNLFERGNENAQ